MVLPYIIFWDDPTIFCSSVYVNGAASGYSFQAFHSKNLPDFYCTNMGVHLWMWVTLHLQKIDSDYTILSKHIWPQEIKYLNKI